MSDTGDGIEGLIGRIDRYVAIEHGLFVLLGQRSIKVDDPSAASLLATHSRQHAWHADLWRERRPVLTSTRPDAVDPDAAAAAMEPVLAMLSQAASAAVFCAGLYRVLLPRLVVAYDRELRRARAGVDGPTERLASLVLFDCLEQWKAGEAFVVSSISRAVSPDSLWRFCARLEASIVHGGTW